MSDSSGTRRPAAVVALLLAIALRADASVIYVNDDAAGANDGASWASAYTSLQSALTAAGAGDEIWVAAGTYKPTGGTDRNVSFALKNSVAVDGGFAGTETLRADRNAALNVSTLSGEIGAAGAADNSYHVVTAASSVTLTSLLDGVTITAGNADGGFPLDRGAAVYISGSPRIENCTITGNSGAVGGALSTDALTSASPVIKGCTFTANTGSAAGAVLLFNGFPSVTSCVIRGNSTTGGGGSGGALVQSTVATFSNTVFAGNSGGQAGGLASFSSSTVTVSNCTFFKNSSGSFGAGVYINSSTMTINNSIVAFNTPAEINGSPAVTYSLVRGGYAGTGNISGDPLFASSVSLNARLTPGSPAIDAGDNTAVTPGITTDLDGNSRFVNVPARPDTGNGTASIVDMGAYEFAPAAAYTLTVTKGGTGSGTVTSAPSGISCGTTCSALFPAGSSLTLTATPSSGSSFIRWGGACAGSGSCTLTVNAAESVTATFGNVIYVDADAVGTNDGSSWTNAYNDLQSALSAAVSGQHQIWVAQGTYKPTSGSDRSATFSLKDMVGVYGGFTGTETDFAQRNAVLNETILSGEIGAAGVTDNSRHIVTALSSVGSTTVLDGFTIRDGYASTSSIAGNSGAGLYIEGSVSVGNCRILNNGAVGGFGGGVMVNGSGAPSFFACTFMNNSAASDGNAGGPGGAFCSNGSQPVTITGCTFHANSASQGGAIEFFTGGGTISSSLFTNNGTHAIHTNLATAIVNCTFSGNSANVVVAAGASSIANSILWGNGGTASVASVTYSDVEGGVAGTGNINVDPLFVNAAGGDFTLQATSPGIDAGNTAAVPASNASDRAGNPRTVDDPARTDSGAGGPPVVDMGAFERFSAAYSYTVSAVTAGNGFGTIASSPSGLACGVDCSETWPIGTFVTVTATEGSGSTFTGWTGGGCGAAPSCSFTVLGPITVTATFTRPVLTVSKAGAGSGTLTSVPSGIACGATCSAAFDNGEVVSLIATPGSGSYFTGWGGACAGTGACQVTMNQDRSVTATFQPLTLTVVRNGTGSGTVTSAPAGISCGATCAAIFDFSTSVQLTAVAAAGSSFTGWSGVPCSGVSTCNFTLTTPVTATATFSAIRYVNQFAGGANNGTSWTDAYTTLQSALAAAVAGDEIWVAAGTYKPTGGTDRAATFSLKSGVGLYGGFAGSETLRSQRNAQINVAMLSGEIGAGDNSDNSYHVVTGNSVASSAIMDGFTISGGNANVSGGDQLGGGVFLNSASAQIVNTIITGNSALAGGGVAIVTSGSPTLSDLTIAGNTATSAFGGGIFMSSGGGLTLVRCTLTGNSSAGDGGALSLSNGSSTVTDCDIALNTAATRGGGIHTNVHTLTMTRTLIRQNVSTSSTGAAMALVGGSSLITNCVVRDNSGVGGGMYFQATAASVVNTTFTRNTSSGGTGILFVDSPAPYPTLTNCILWGDTPSEVHAGGTPTITFSDVQGGFAGSGNISTDPLFRDAPIGNVRLGAASPAIDAGNNAAAALLAVDYEGNSRRIDAPRTDTGVGTPPLVDMGAYEFSPVTVSAPLPAAACPGESTGFSVVASGREPLSYQWRKDGDPIAGAIGPSYVVDPVSIASAGTYTVLVTDSIGTSALSAGALLTVRAAPSISTQPFNATVCSGEQATFTVTAAGTDLTYQWRRSSSDIPGATTSSFTVPSASAGDAGSYDVVITGACVPPVTSSAATLTVNAAPSVGTHPVNASACAGQPATFSVIASGTGLSYQWRKGSVNIPGATSSTYAIAAILPGDGGMYDVVVTGTCAPPAISNGAALTVLTPPLITQQPADVTVCRTQPATFSVLVSGSALTYQWRRNSVNIEGATGSTYSIAATTASDGGAYDVVVSGACTPPQTSSAVTLTVQTPPQISVQPSSTAVCVGSPTTLTVTASGTNLSYQWRKGALPIDGATAASLVIPSATIADAGNYDVVLTGTCGTLTSSVAVLTVNAQPAIDSFSPISGAAGATVTIHGGALTGTTSVTFNGHPAAFTLVSDVEISATVPAGATSGPLSVTKAGCTVASSAGSFSVLGSFGAPMNLLATAVSMGEVFVSWLAVDSAHHYEVYRTSGSGYVVIGSPVGSAWRDLSCPAGSTCAYRVRAVDAVGTTSGYSNVDLATVMFFTDDLVIAQSTVVKAVHWIEMRAAVTAACATAGVALPPFTDASLAGAVIRKVHLQEIRAALDAARSALGVPPVNYSTATAALTTVRAADVQEIRGGVK